MRPVVELLLGVFMTGVDSLLAPHTVHVSL